MEYEHDQQYEQFQEDIQAVQSQIDEIQNHKQQLDGQQEEIQEKIRELVGKSEEVQVNGQNNHLQPEYYLHKKCQKFLEDKIEAYKQKEFERDNSVF